MQTPTSTRTLKASALVSLVGRCLAMVRANKGRHAIAQTLSLRTAGQHQRRSPAARRSRKRPRLSRATGRGQRQKSPFSSLRVGVDGRDAVTLVGSGVTLFDETHFRTVVSVGVLVTA